MESEFYIGQAAALESMQVASDCAVNVTEIPALQDAIFWACTLWLYIGVGIGIVIGLMIGYWYAKRKYGSKQEPCK